MWPDAGAVNQHHRNPPNVLRGDRSTAHHKAVGPGSNGDGLLRLKEPCLFVTTSRVCLHSVASSAGAKRHTTCFVY